MISAPEYQVGLDSEARVIFLLNLKPSTKEENIHQDIDAWDSNGFSYSIKAQEIAARTKNFAFELSVTDVKGREKESWYYKGKANYYLILVKDTIYQICKESLENHVYLYGWDSVRTLSRSTQDSQARIGHNHANARLGLISINNCRLAGLIMREFQLPG